MGKELKMENDFKSVIKSAVRHCKILANGFMSMIYGTVTAGAFAMAIYGFVMIPKEGGWAAVADFILACATFCCAVYCMYAQGRNKKKGAKK